MSTYLWELLQQKHLLQVHLPQGIDTTEALHVHLSLGIASTEASPTCPPTAGNCFNRSIYYMSTYRRELLQQKHLQQCPPTAGYCFQQKHLLHVLIVHLPQGIASPSAYSMSTHRRELLQQKHLLHVHLPLGTASIEASPTRSTYRKEIASTEASPTMPAYRRELLQQKHLQQCPPTAGNCFNRSVPSMSTYRRELLQQKHLLNVHLPLEIASIEASPTCPPTAGNC
jgi:hypothetical protein